MSDETRKLLEEIESHLYGHGRWDDMLDAEECAKIVLSLVLRKAAEVAGQRPKDAERNDYAEGYSDGRYAAEQDILALVPKPPAEAPARQPPIDPDGACACIGPQNGEPLCPCAMRRAASGA